MMIKGIDVSYAQDNIDWKRVKAAGVQFAMIRVGWCYNNGALKMDTLFKQHINGAIAAGIDIGIYLYSYATTPQAARKAAQETIKAIKGYKISYPIAFDIEYESIYTNGSKSNNTAITKAFLDEIEKSGYYAMLYCSKDFLDSHLSPAELTAYDKWIAQYASQCTCKHPYGMWQYTGSGRVNGISGNVDCNYAYKDYRRIIQNMKKEPSQKDKLPYTVIVNAPKEELSKKGYFVFMSGGKVCVGKFATQSEAQNTLLDLKSKGYSGKIGKW